MPKPSEGPLALQVSDFKQYLSIPLLLWYYKEINKAGSLESDVDAFYLNFLKEVFTLRDNFGVEQESRPAKELVLSQRSDFTIRYIKNGDPKKNPNETLYLTVNVGTYLRFYELPGKSRKPKDWAPAGGSYHELANDEEEVWKLWNHIRDLVKSH
ncbi:hypothetical protein EsDP_00006572 [Epichloe bromicola]|uniref:Uncharacterized protein n=1 Tax=Epichloe bromicola TaxID=79588 RepID=A0ABQ0CY22_9HYPO